MQYKLLIKTIKGRLDAIDRIANDESTRLATLGNVWMSGFVR
jgi:hypothetical protein